MLQTAREVCFAVPEGLDDSMFRSVDKGEKDSEEFFNKWQEQVR